METILGYPEGEGAVVGGIAAVYRNENSPGVRRMATVTADTDATAIRVSKATLNEWNFGKKALREAFETITDIERHNLSLMKREDLKAAGFSMFVESQGLVASQAATEEVPFFADVAESLVPREPITVFVQPAVRPNGPLSDRIRRGM